jgi:hypothetical protein
MSRGKDAFALFSFLVLAGCIGLPLQRSADRGGEGELPPILPPPRTDGRAIPELRISTPPAVPSSSPLARAGQQPDTEIRTTALAAPAPQFGSSSTPPPHEPERPLTRPAENDGPPLPGQGEGAGRLRILYLQAASRYAGIDSYIVRLRRREQIGGVDKPEELLLVKFRQRPWSVYFKWLGPEGKGREVVYVNGTYEDKIHTLLAAGDMPFTPAGRQIALAPDSALVRSSSRHSIHEAGVGVLIDHFGQILQATERGDMRQGSLRYVGIMKRPDLEAPVEAVEQTIPPHAEPQLPHGGRRLWGFDPVGKLTVLIITQNEVGHEVEYYCYDRFQFPVRLDDDDFNPDKLWPAKGKKQ